MEALIKILSQMQCWLEERFKIRTIKEERGVINGNTTLEVKNYFAYQLQNNGNITAIINGVQLVRPDTTFSNANWEGYTFSEDIRITFDDADVYGFNTAGATKRIEYIVKKIL